MLPSLVKPARFRSNSSVTFSPAGLPVLSSAPTSKYLGRCDAAKSLAKAQTAWLNFVVSLVETVRSTRKDSRSPSRASSSDSVIIKSSSVLAAYEVESPGSVPFRRELLQHSIVPYLDHCCHGFARFTSDPDFDIFHVRYNAFHRRAKSAFASRSDSGGTRRPESSFACLRFGRSRGLGRAGEAVWWPWAGKAHLHALCLEARQHRAQLGHSFPRGQHGQVHDHLAIRELRQLVHMHLWEESGNLTETASVVLFGSSLERPAQRLLDLLPIEVSQAFGLAGHLRPQPADLVVAPRHRLADGPRVPEHLHSKLHLVPEAFQLRQEAVPLRRQPPPHLLVRIQPVARADDGVEAHQI